MTLSHAETMREAQEANELLKAGGQDYMTWIKLGRGLALMRDDAMRRSHNNMNRFRTIMGELLREHGFGDGPLHDKAVRSRLLAIVDNYSEVHRWREALAPNQKLLWSHPTTIWRRCPLFQMRKCTHCAAKVPRHAERCPRCGAVKRAKGPSPMEQLHNRNVSLQEELGKAQEQAKRADGGSNIDFDNDTVPDMAATIARGLRRPERIRQLINALTKEARQLEKRGEAMPKDKPAKKSAAEAANRPKVALVEALAQGIGNDSPDDDQDGE